MTFIEAYDLYNNYYIIYVYVALSRGRAHVCNALSFTYLGEDLYISSVRAEIVNLDAYKVYGRNKTFFH